MGFTRHNPRRPHLIDQAAIEKAVADIIVAIGEDPHREGLRDTPKRVARAYAEIFSGLGKDPVEELRVGFEEGHREMVIIKDLPFYSMCEHHLLPFMGTTQLGYIPDGKVIGVSKLARLVEVLSRRPQLQERLTTEIADTITRAVNADGVAVLTSAEHLCMTMRGIKKPGSKVVTSAMRGYFRKSAKTRSEFLALVGQS